MRGMVTPLGPSRRNGTNCGRKRQQRLVYEVTGFQTGPGLAAGEPLQRSLTEHAAGGIPECSPRYLGRLEHARGAVESSARNLSRGVRHYRVHVPSVLLFLARR
jgi:hypothetical protein